LQVFLSIVKRLLEAGALNAAACNVLTLAELIDLTLNFEKFLFASAKALHDYHGLIIDCLAEVPRHNPEVDASRFKHVEDTVENLLVEEVTLHLKGEALHAH